MKAILYIGAVLMTGASVYGFVDYKKSKQKVSTLYDVKQGDKSPDTKSVFTEKKEVVEKPAPPAKGEVPVKAKIPPAASKVAVLKKSNNDKNKVSVKRKKKLSYKMYSRAPLDEKYLEKDLQLKEPKKEESKIENKEQ